MPVHDWTRVPAGTFHDFHNRLISHLTEVLNERLLPEDYYAQSEQRVDDVVADLLTLRRPKSPKSDRPEPSGGTAVAEAPPRVAGTLGSNGLRAIGLKQKRVVVRHVSRHQVIAVIEIVSPANKDRAATAATFVRKAVDAIGAGVHLLLVDLFPPGRHDADGLHAAIWEHFGDDPYEPPAGKPLFAASFDAGLVAGYVEPFAVGDEPPTMPLFLEPGWYVNLPLGPSYDAAWRGTPGFWREVVEGREPPPE